MARFTLDDLNSGLAEPDQPAAKARFTIDDIDLGGDQEPVNDALTEPAESTTSPADRVPASFFGGRSMPGEDALNDPAAGSPRTEDSWGEIGRKLIQNAPTMLKQAGGGVLQMMAESGPTPPLGIDAHDPQWQSAVVEPHRELTEAAREAGTLPGQKLYEEATEELRQNAPQVDPESLKGYAYDITQGIIQMVPSVAATLATRQPVVGATIIGGQVAGPRYGESREAGRTPDQATADAAFYAAAEGIPEMIPLGILMKPGKAFLSRTLKTAGAEGIQEMFTEALQTGYDVGVLDEEMTWGEAVSNIRRAGIVGIGVGAGMAVGTQPFMRRAEQPAPGPQDETGLPEGAVPADTLFGQEAAPEGVRERARAETPPPTPEDEASPIPTDIIQEGKAALQDAQGGIGASQILENAGLPPIDTEVTLATRDGGTIRGTVVDAFDQDGQQGAKIRLENGRVVAETFEQLQGRISPVLPQESAQDQQQVDESADTIQEVVQPTPAEPLTQSLQMDESDTPTREVVQPELTPAAPAPVSTQQEAEPVDIAGQELQTEPVSPDAQRSLTQEPATAEPQVQARQPVARRDIEDGADTAVTAAGREVPVRYTVVEASDLLASQLDDGRVNPDYPADLQPRDRSRAVSTQQVQDIAQRLNPRLVERSPRAADGAPIIADDGVVESGNGRVLAIRRAYTEGLDTSQQYRDYLAQQGYPVEGMNQPVLVRVREGEMTPEDRAAFTREANERDTLGMSATERAMADATALPDRLLEAYRGGDIDAAANRPFVRSFIDSVVGRNEQAGVIAADGTLSQEAIRRIEGALLAKAYGDADLVASLIESPDTNIKAIGGALMDVAPAWAQMRADAQAGQIDPVMDQTDRLLEAVRLVHRARREGRNVAELVGQRDMLSGDAMHPIAEGYLRLMFRNTQSWTQPAGREKLADGLRFYLESAEKAQPGVDLFGEAAPAPDRILETAKGKQYGREEAGTQQDLLAQPAGRPGERDGQGGRERAEQPEQSAEAPRGEEAARPGTEGAVAEAVTPPAESPLLIEDYTDKSVIVRGQTKENIDRIKAAGKAAGVRALWNKKAQGWVFPKARETQVRESLADLLQGRPAVADTLRGDKIDDEWTAFNPDMTLGVPRDSMPQVKAEHRGALANFLNARNIPGEEQTVRADSLMPTQREFSEAKVDTAKAFTGGNRAILVSSDNRILDGHHQWMAAVDRGEEIRVIRLDAPIADLLEKIPEFPSAEGSDGAVSEQATLQSATEAERRDETQRDIYNRRLEDITDPAELRAYAEELRTALMTDERTGLGSNRAWISRTPKAYVASIDLDSLKWVNDNMGHDAGDRMIAAVGDALRQAGLANDAFHVSGDEFYAQSDNAGELRAALDAAQEALREMTIEGDGLNYTGPGFSYGFGTTIEQAERGLHDNKTSREEAGQRAARGERPQGVAEAPQVPEPERAAGDREEAPADREGQGAERSEPGVEQGEIVSTPNQGAQLYHGTNAENLEAIENAGKITGPVYLTPRRDMALEYSDGESVVEVWIPEDALKIDFDLPGGRLLTVEEANRYSDNEDWTIQDYIDDGRSVGVEQDVLIRPPARRPGSPELLETIDRLEAEALSLPVPVSAEDVPYQSGYDAYRNISHTPDDRARQEQIEYLQEMLDVHEDMVGRATDENRGDIVSELERYRDNYLRMNRSVLSAKSRTASAYITGGSNFPESRNRKRLDTEQKRVDEFLEWREKARKAIRRKFSPAEQRAISSTDPDAIQKLRDKLVSLEQAQERMKAANKIVRNKRLSDTEKTQQLQSEAGLSEDQAVELLKPDFSGRVGFPQYALTNNNAKMRTVMERIGTLESRQEVAESVGGAVVAEFDGGEVEVNYVDGYVRVRHDQKPSAEVRQALKSGGFRWAPSDGAWRRKLTNQALWKAAQITRAELPETATSAPDVSDTEGQFALAYHGTPHTFDRFSLEAIGSGEGAQAYGWGLYFAGRRNIAEYYARALRGSVAEEILDYLTPGIMREAAKDGDFSRPKNIAALIEDYWRKDVLLRQMTGNLSFERSIEITRKVLNDGLFRDLADITSRIDKLVERIESVEREIYSADRVDGESVRQQEARITEAKRPLREKLRQLEREFRVRILDESERQSPQSNLYQVDIPEESELLDWDAPLREQEPSVIKALEEGRLLNDYALDATGADIYNALAENMGGQQAASELLNSIGIPGLRYLDAASRDGRNETRNYVIWDERRVTVEAVNDELRQARQLAAGNENESFSLRDDFATDAEAVTTDLAGRLKQLGIADKVALNLRERIQAVVDGKASEADGRYLNRLIEVSLATKDPVRTLNHEVIHALRDMGLIRDAEWRALEKAARADTDRMETTRQRYGRLDLNEDQIAEEAIAEMYVDWAAGQTQAGGFLRRAFERIRDFIQALGRALRGRGFNTMDSVFQAIERGDVGSRQPRDAQGRFEKFALSDPRATDPTAKGGAQARQKAANQWYGTQPLDQAFRLPWQLFGGINEHGEWNPGLKLSKKTGTLITNAKFSEEGRFSWMNPTLEKARAGLLDRYGLDPEYVERERQRGLDERQIMAKVPEIMQRLQEANVGTTEAKVLQAVLTGEAVADADMAKLAEPIRDAIDDMGAEAVQLGLISAEAFERNRGAYLHRVYLKHEGDQGGLVRWVSRVASQRRRKIIGNQFKGRGLWIEVDKAKLLQRIPGFREAERGAPVQGERFRVLDLVEGADQETLRGIDPKSQRRVLNRIYLPADAPVPDNLTGYVDRGLWEVRGTKKGNIVLWRDFSKSERASMGEIVDARYTIAKTYMQMAHDLSTGRFFQDIALNQDWSTQSEPRAGTWADAQEYSRLWADPAIDWVRVPDTNIAKSQTKRYGALAGRYVRAEIWRDLNELEKMQKAGVWNTLLTQWKLNKTARNPVVHMNNIMSNVILMDLADVRAVDLGRAIRSMLREDADYQDAIDHGAFGSDMVAQEIRKNTLQPLLEEIQRDMQGGRDTMEAKFGLVGKLADAIWSRGKNLDRKMTNLYQLEDEVFRMATYLRKRSLGFEANEAAIQARDQFLNYDIRAPWVNAARRSVLPFISYTYRAVPIVAQSVMLRPWKLAKYATLAYAANALAYMLDDGDEDEERRSLRDTEQGNTWIGAPRMIRMPWSDDHGNPVFLDIRRWIPAGDVFDMNQGNAAFAIPAPLQFGGPLMLAFELALNKQAFTGKEITNDRTDDWWDKTSKVADWGWKSWMPSAAWIPGSWYWEKIGNAASGVRDNQGRPYSIPQAVASSVGVKLKAQDVQEAFMWKGIEFDRVERELKAELRSLHRDRARGMLSRSALEKRQQRLMEKFENLSRERKRTFTGEE